MWRLVELKPNPSPNPNPDCDPTYSPFESKGSATPVEQKRVCLLQETGFARVAVHAQRLRQHVLTNAYSYCIEKYQQMLNLKVPPRLESELLVNLGWLRPNGDAPLVLRYEEPPIKLRRSLPGNCRPSLVLVSRKFSFC